MNRYIALLRGINVGGHHIVKMAELRKFCETIGLSRVQTYIQSGNVLFESDMAEQPLQRKLEESFQAEYGFAVPTMLRTFEELIAVRTRCPFSEKEIAEAEAATQAESLYVAYLGDQPDDDRFEALQAYRTDHDECRLDGRELFMLFRNGIRNSKLADNLHRLGVPVTVRNWKTTKKLAELASAWEQVSPL